MIRRDFLYIVGIFLVWRILLFLVAFIATILIPIFGGRFPYANVVLEVTKLPSWIWGFGNFDGVHYLRIAQNGYNAEHSQVFFPLYPVLIKVFTEGNIFINKISSLDRSIFVDPAYFYSGLLLSNIFFILALYFFYKLILLDYNSKTALKSIILLLVFPTSFYFVGIYTESLFLLLSVISIYSIRRKNVLLGGVFGLLASATRIFGLLLIPFILTEFYLKIRNKDYDKRSIAKSILAILLIPFGTVFYMFYLNSNFNNPLYFLTSQSAFGAERSSEVILLPQVLFRYFKIFFTVPANSLVFLNAFLEFVFTLIPLIALYFAFRKIRLSYWIFTLGCLILPTLTGTLSSMPRYALMSFLLFPFIVQFMGRSFKIVTIGLMILQIILVSLFIRGYWVA